MAVEWIEKNTTVQKLMENNICQGTEDFLSSTKNILVANEIENWVEKSRNID